MYMYTCVYLFCILKIGGDFYDAVIPLMNKNGRVAIVGAMSQYNLENPKKGRMFNHVASYNDKVTIITMYVMTIVQGPG